MAAGHALIATGEDGVGDEELVNTAAAARAVDIRVSCDAVIGGGGGVVCAGDGGGAGHESPAVVRGSRDMDGVIRLRSSFFVFIAIATNLIFIIIIITIILVIEIGVEIGVEIGGGVGVGVASHG